MTAQRRPHWYRLALPLAVLVVIAVTDAILGPDVILSAGYAISALIAGAITTVRRTAVLAVTAVVLSALAGVWNEDLGTREWAIRVSLSVVLGAVGIGWARIRTQRERDLQHMTLIAETAQRAVLRALPQAVGSVGFAARYVSATQAALVGGDLYEVSETPYGIRVIVGDVRGKGLPAVQLAATVLSAFRRASFLQSSLTAVATELDRVVGTVADDEDFVTAVLAEFHDDHTVTLVNCGHHAPLLIPPADTATPVKTGEPQLPLGLGPTPRAVTSSWPAGARLLMYTDGLIETRNGRGVFFPLAAHAVMLRGGSLEEALDMLLSRLADYADGKLDDDIALVLAEHRQW